jgi:hypothetical protein
MRRQAWGRASGLAMTHCHRDFTVCSCSSLPVLLPGRSGALRNSMCSTTADGSGEPVMRSALVKARRRIACCAHCGTGCSHAPRPGRLLPVSTITANSPFPVGTATTRSSSTANSRFRHPAHVRTGPPMCRCARAEGSRWITAQSSVTESMVRTTRGCAAMSRAPGLAVVGHSVGGAVFGLALRIPPGTGGRIPADVDTPPGEPGGQPRVLALLADGQR